MKAKSQTIAAAVALLFITGGSLRTLTNALDLLRSDVLASTAARDKVFVQPRKTLALGKTPARVKAGLWSAARSVLPRAATYCPLKIIRILLMAPSLVDSGKNSLDEIVGKLQF
jgi:hypothetical protein